MNSIDNVAQSFFIALIFCSIISDSYIVLNNFFENNYIKKKVNYFKKIYKIVVSLSFNDYKNDNNGNIIIDTLLTETNQQTELLTETNQQTELLTQTNQQTELLIETSKQTKLLRENNKQTKLLLGDKKDELLLNDKKDELLLNDKQNKKSKKSLSNTSNIIMKKIKKKIT